MGEHRPVRGDGRFGSVLRVAVAALFVVAAGCAALLMVGRGGSTTAASRDAGCDRLCAAAGPSGAPPAGVAPPTNPTHQGQDMPDGSAPPAARSSASPSTGGSQSPGKAVAGTSGTASSSPSSSSAAGRVVPFTVTADWGSGYQVNLVVANDTAAPVIDWKLTLRIGGTATVHQVSSAKATPGPGGALTVTPLDWDATLAPGARVTVNFGFDGAYVTPAADCVFDGQPCTLQVSVPKN